MKSVAILILPALLALSTGCEPSAAGSPTAKGEHAYDNYCAQCHMPDGSGNPANEAPAIAGLPAWYVQQQLDNFREGIRGTHYDDIGGMRMRPMALALTDEAQIPATADWVAKMAPVNPAGTVKGDADKGKKHFGTCVACHGADGAGNEAMHAPPLTNTHDWYLLTQLKHFKGKVRGASKEDEWGTTMAPMANTLADDQAMKDVIAYINTL